MNTNISRESMSSPVTTAMIVDTEICNSSPSSPTSPSLSIVASSPSSSSSTTHTNEKKTIEFLLKEMKEEGKKEEEHDDDNFQREKKNNSDVKHTSGTTFINIEPTQVCLGEQEKEKKDEEEEEAEEEKQGTEQSSNHLHADDEHTVRADLTKNAQGTNMINTDLDEQRYKTVEIEEIPDEDEDLSICNNSLIEPTDCILTDDELKPSPPTSSSITKSTKNSTFSFDPVLSCYETALSKTVTTGDESVKPPNAVQTPVSPKRSQRPEDDPIALRALQRFEERMNAAAAAVATKNHADEASPLTLKGKSSWSGTLATPRKSIENLFKANQQSSDGEELSPSRDTFIRPRKTMLDDNGLNFGMTLNLFGTGPNDSTLDDHQQDKPKEQQPPSAMVEDENKQSEFITRSFFFFYPIRDTRINYTLELTNRPLYFCLLLSFPSFILEC